MKNIHPVKYMSVAALSAAAVMLASGCHRDKKESTAQDGPMPVEVATPEIDSITLYKDYPGTLQARDWAEVVGRVNGILQKRYYKEGDYVTKGQLLVSIEPSQYADQVRQAKAGVAKAESQYEYYSRQYEAMKKAYESEAVSKMDVLQAETSMRQALASIEEAKASLDQSSINLGYCSVRAPLSGYITSSDLNPGAYVNGEGGAAVLATIVDNSAFHAIFNVEDSQYQKMISSNTADSKGMYRTIPLKFSSPMPHEYTADLAFTSPSVDQSTGTLMLKGDVANPYGELKNGMYLTVALPYGRDPHAILVKDASLSSDQLGKYLYVVNDSNRVVYTPVKTGPLYRDSLRVIESGLRPGQRYVTKALLTVRPGMEVKPVMAK